MSAATDKKDREAATQNLRLAINNAYAFIKGCEATSSFVATSFEELMQKQMDRLQGKNLSGRSAPDRIQSFRDNLTSAINQIKSSASDQFNYPDQNNANSVNTTQ